MDADVAELGEVAIRKRGRQSTNSLRAGNCSRRLNLIVGDKVADVREPGKEVRNFGFALVVGQGRVSYVGVTGFSCVGLSFVHLVIVGRREVIVGRRGVVQQVVLSWRDRRCPGLELTHVR